MSGRIRTIKPEMLEDEKTAKLSHLEFRLFVSLIMMADDYGNLRGETGLIRGQAMWGCTTDQDTTHIEAALVQLEEVGLVRSYLVRSQRYIHICGWSKHQRVDKPGKPRVPGPDDPEVAEDRAWQTYFFRMGESGPIKIGRSTNVEGRLASLSKGAPSPLVVLKVMPGDVEREMHKKFAHLRKHQEWFEPGEDLLAFLSENDSRPIRESFAPDLRPPTNEQRTTTGQSDPPRVVVVGALPEEKPLRGPWREPQLMGRFAAILKGHPKTARKSVNQQLEHARLSQQWGEWFADAGEAERFAALEIWVKRWLDDPSTDPAKMGKAAASFIGWCDHQEGLGIEKTFVPYHEPAELPPEPSAEDREALRREGAEWNVAELLGVAS